MVGTELQSDHVSRCFFFFGSFKFSLLSCPEYLARNHVSLWRAFNVINELLNDRRFYLFPIATRTSGNTSHGPQLGTSKQCQTLMHDVNQNS